MTAASHPERHIRFGAIAGAACVLAGLATMKAGAFLAGLVMLLFVMSMIEDNHYASGQEHEDDSLFGGD